MPKQTFISCIPSLTLRKYSRKDGVKFVSLRSCGRTVEDQYLLDMTWQSLTHNTCHLYKIRTVKTSAWMGERAYQAPYRAPSLWNYWQIRTNMGEQFFSGLWLCIGCLCSHKWFYINEHTGSTNWTQLIFLSEKMTQSWKDEQKNILREVWIIGDDWLDIDMIK